MFGDRLQRSAFMPILFPNRDMIKPVSSVFWVISFKSKWWARG